MRTCRIQRAMINPEIEFRIIRGVRCIVYNGIVLEPARMTRGGRGHFRKKRRQFYDTLE
jgi:hypothetical protein